MKSVAKILVCGDLHHRKEACMIAIEKFRNEDYDKIIFMGDYFDSFDRPNSDAIMILNMIIDLKKEFEDRVILLLGNHCIQYMHFSDLQFRCSGFRPDLAVIVSPILKANRNLFQIAHKEEGKKDKHYLFTHAGVQRKWFKKYQAELESVAKKCDLVFDYKPNLAEILNATDQTASRHILHEVGVLRGGIRYDYGGPTWCDRREIIEYGPIPGFHQIVGHTPIPFIEKVDKFEGDKHYNNTTVTFVDVINDTREDAFLTLNT